MGPCSSFGNTEEQDNEPYYCTPAYGPEDIICPGSDTEETPEETFRKRLRYEAAARRYMRGHLPVLLSASLRGPFSKKSGWVNPWSRRPRMKQKQNLPQRDSADMNSTQTKSADKALAPSLGYVNPANVLAWQAGVGSTGRTVHREGLVNLDKTEEPMEEMTIISAQWDYSNKAPTSTDSVARPEDSINHYATPNVGNDSRFTLRGTKRAVDLQWLRGSYVSKRARWNGPALSSPTPGPDTISLRDGERKHASTRLADPGNATPNREPQSRTQFLDAALENPQQTPATKKVAQVNSFFSARVESQRTFHPETPHTGFRSVRMAGMSQQEAEIQNIDELQGDSQGSSSGSRKSSRRSSRRSPNITVDRSSSDLEHDDLIVITPRPKTFATPTIAGSNLHMNFRSGSLPKLSRPPDYNYLEVEEDSFISDVAPSSRNLEKFYFKKKRECTKSTEPEKLGVDYAQDTVPSVVLRSELSEGDDRVASNVSILSQRMSGEQENGPDNKKIRGEIGGLTNGMECPVQDRSSSTPFSKSRRPPSRDQEPSSNSGESDASWNMMNDICPKVLSARAGKSQRTTTTNEQGSLPKPSKKSILPSKEDPNIQQPDSLTEPNHTLSEQHPRIPPQRSTHMSLSVQGSGPSQDQNDICTQPRNTTPVKSQISVHLPQPANVAKLPRAEDLEGSLIPSGSSPVEEQDEMNGIQLELSQVCASSSPDCTCPSGDDKIVEPIHRSNVEYENLASTDALEGQAQGDFAQQSQHCPDGPQREHEVERALLGEEAVQHGGHEGNAKLEQPNKILQDPHAEDRVAETEAHVGANETTQKNESDDAARQGSEASWQGCGPQSPWTTEHLEPIPVQTPRIEDLAEPSSPSELEGEASLMGHIAPEQNDVLDTSSDWQRIERPQTPESSTMETFKELMTPIESPERTKINPSEALRSTQLLMDAATINPWTSSRKNPASVKTRKRVSFGDLFSKDTEDLQQVKSDTLKPGPVSPSLRTMPPQDEDKFDSGMTTVSNFEKHFTARKFKRILPENVGSQFNSSPGLGAQAEAFIAADRETSTEQEPTTTYKTPTRHLKPKSEANSNIAWKQRGETDTLVPSYPRFEGNPQGSSSLGNFDMEEALTEVGNFLEDWSVDSELKKAKGPDANRGDSNNNGYRRRKLFGLV